MIKQIKNPTKSLLRLKTGESIKDVCSHQVCIESTIQRLKKQTDGKWSVSKKIGFIEITRIK